MEWGYFFRDVIRVLAKKHAFVLSHFRGKQIADRILPTNLTQYSTMPLYLDLFFSNYFCIFVKIQV